MKKCFVVIVFVLLIFFFALPCMGQEGRWVEVQEGRQMWDRHYFSPKYYFIGKGYWFLLSDSLLKPDSVWVPGECPEDSLPRIIWSVYYNYSADTVRIDSLAILETSLTHYQESQLLWRWAEEEKERCCQEIWECVREKLIEFLEERDPSGRGK